MYISRDKVMTEQCPDKTEPEDQRLEQLLWQQQDTEQLYSTTSDLTKVASQPCTGMDTSEGRTKNKC